MPPAVLRWLLTSRLHVQSSHIWTPDDPNPANTPIASQGCWKCRSRKVKCDETKPGCLACRRIGVSCTGYDANFVWVEDDGQINPSQGRRILPC
ncbi:hypothetical protein AUP68_12151, partial [Ilyonectria robusta]